jgi:hypothetical protein
LDSGLRIGDWPGLERPNWGAYAHEQSVTLRGERATFVSSLKRGVMGSRLRSIEKSSDCFVVGHPEAGYVSNNKLSEMKARQIQSNSKLRPWTILRRSSQRHDPMLVFNMALFNFTSGWSRILARDQYARFSV